MKGRILRFLKELKQGKNEPLALELMAQLNVTGEELQQRAASALTDVLHQYGRFSVVTIDSFFHQVIRSFAKEVGLQGTFTIDLEQDKVMTEVIEQMLAEIGDENRKQLRQWLIQFAESNVEEGKRWDFKQEIEKLAKEIMKERFKGHADEILKLSADKHFFSGLKQELHQIQNRFQQQIEKIANEGLSLLQQYGLEGSDFKGGSRSSPGLIFKRMLDDNYTLTKTQRSSYKAPTEWIKAKDPNTAQLMAALEGGVLRCHDQIIDTLDSEIESYQSAKEVLRFFYTFGILAQLHEYLQRYRDEHDVMLIADLPDFLRRIIHDSDTPYVYEKVGSVFSHYLIDEFQDTSTFQWDNFRPLVKNSTDSDEFSMIVGDVKQSIYRFRGGDWELLQSRVKSDMGEAQAEEFMLGANYRSSPQLVTFNNSLFPFLRDLGREGFMESLDEVPDPARQADIATLIDLTFSTYSDVTQTVPDQSASKKGAVLIKFLESDEVSEEENWMDEALKRTILQVESLQRQGYALRDMAILTRYTGEGRRVAQAFIDYRNSDQADPSLRYEVVSSEALYLTSSHLVRFVVSMLKWLTDESNTIALSEWMHEYHHYLKGQETTIFPEVQHWEKHVPSDFAKQRVYLKTQPLYELVESLIRIFHLENVPDEYTYLQGFQDAVLEYSKTERGDVPSFLVWWENVRKDRSIKLADENDAIKIMTIHKSKGLEFPIVLIPFMNWSLDHDPTKDTILWCKGGDMAPFDKLPVVPLKYSKNLASTYWAQDYYQERLKAFLDNLNLIYVAFTRPIVSLWAVAPKPKKSGKQVVSDIIYRYASNQAEWDEVTGHLKLGDVPDSTQKAGKTIEYGLSTYHTHPWRGKVSVQIKNARELKGDFQQSAIWQGIEIHQLLSKIRYEADLEAFAGTPVYEKLVSIVRHSQLNGWFQEPWLVDTEVPILLPGGDLKRIDRINRSENQTVVIDFKTGSPRDADVMQVRGYVSLLEQMGFKQVNGFLFYLGEKDVVAV